MIEMDGFVIELEVDADEQLMVSREEPYKPPDYRCACQRKHLHLFYMFSSLVEVPGASSVCRSFPRSRRLCHTFTKRTTYRLEDVLSLCVSLFVCISPKIQSLFVFHQKYSLI